MPINCRIIDLGKTSYKDAYDFQRRIVDEVRFKLSSQHLILCEHFPVITLGRSGKTENLLVDNQTLKKEGIDFFKIDRGGDITAHEPGQLTIYPIFNLKARKEPDIHLYLNNLENVILDTLFDFGLKPKTIKHKRGIWIKNKKIASIGIGVSHWITYHGLSINVNNNLRTFSFIRPCGMDIEVTSVAKELGKPVNLNDFKQMIIAKFEEIFKLNITYTSLFLLGTETCSAV